MTLATARPDSPSSWARRQIPSDTPPSFVVVDAEGREVKRYGWRDSARRRSQKIPGSRVVTLADWYAECAAVHAEVMDEHAEEDAAQAEAERREAEEEAASERLLDDPTYLAAMAGQEQDAPADELAEVEAERAENAAAAHARYAVRRAPLATDGAELVARHGWEPAPFEVERIPWDEPTEMTGTDWPEVQTRADRAAEYAARNAEYAARTETGPAVEVMRDGAWTMTRRYECATRAARAARGLATRQKRAQEIARVVDASGTVLLDCETDPLVIQARIDGEVLTGIRPL